MQRRKTTTQNDPPTTHIPDAPEPNLDGPRHHEAFCKWCQSPFVAAFDSPISQDGFIWICPTPACHARQIAKAIRMANGRYFSIPTISAVEMMESRAPYLCWGGAAGGSKTFGLRAFAYWCAINIPNCEILLMRRTFPELEKTHLKDFAKEEHFLPNARFSRGDRAMYVNENHPTMLRSCIQAGHCDAVSDLSKILSTEFDIILLDEGVTFPEDLLVEIPTRARSKKPKVIELLGGAVRRIGTNPGGIGHKYLQDAYMRKRVDVRKYPKYKPELYDFIPARISDNPYLDDKYRDENLSQLSDERRKQLEDGDWDTFVGQFFRMFDPTRDVVTT